MRCEVQKQGGDWVTGELTGRKGKKQLRVAYRISNGEARERWFSLDRVRNIEGDTETLPRYVTKTAKGSTFAAPVVMINYGYNHPKELEQDRRNREAREALQVCPESGVRHELIGKRGETHYDEDGRVLSWETIYTGRRSVKLGDVLAD